MHIPILFRDAQNGTKVLLASAVPQIVLTVLLLANSIRLLESTARAHLENLIALNASMLHAMASAYIDQPGFGPLQDALGELLAQAEDGLAYVRFADDAGNILLSAGVPEHATLNPFDAADSGDGKIAVLPDGRPLVHVRRPLPLPHDQTGSLQFGISNTGPPASWQSVIWQGVLIALPFIPIAFALSSRITRAPARRLKRILAGSKAIADGRLNLRLPDKGRDGLARLAHHFNTVVSVLRQRTRTLHDTLEHLETSKERCTLLISGANDSLWDWDIASGRCRFSPRFCEMLDLPGKVPPSGAPMLETTRAFFTSRLHPDEADAFYNRILEHLKGTSPQFMFEHRIRHEDGGYRWIMSRGAAKRDAQGRATWMAGSISDIHICKCARQQLQHDAMHDALTGLPNQALFIEHLRQALAQQDRNAHFRSAVLAINLERFHLINDSYSHVIGNHLLRHIARHFVERLRSGDIVARLSADQFAILLHGVASTDEALQISYQLIELPGFIAPGARQTLHMTCRAGLAMSGSGGDAGTLLRDADSALQAARGSESAPIQVFQASMHARMLTTLTLETDLRNALAEKALSVAYQPIVRLFDRSIVSFEALARWQHPLRGQIPPDVFIPLAESLDLIHELGMFVLHRTCLDILKWQRQTGPDAPPVSVNLSARQLARATLARELLDTISGHGLTPERLRFEVTESLLTHSSGPNIETLHHLHEAGITVLIDDFGTGYSALSYLHTLPCDIVKLDGSFVGPIATDERPRAVVRHSIGLAHDLGMSVIAERIEKEDQLHTLSAIGCDFGQGYLFSKPLPAGEACRLLRARPLQ
ncbi:MAG: EAL domain-containing protein [Azoarcus sp.]|jgi:diguanylate cyclase (GGDEF)-like protein|nr:EAL domain-containing protein [Azoarcus sp.]